MITHTDTLPWGYEGVLQTSFVLIIIIIKMFQTCMNFFLLLNTNKYILKNAGNQIVDRL